jgi:hypothetical protein
MALEDEFFATIEELAREFGSTDVIVRRRTKTKNPSDLTSLTTITQDFTTVGVVLPAESKKFKRQSIDSKATVILVSAKTLPFTPNQDDDVLTEGQTYKIIRWESISLKNNTDILFKLFLGGKA